MRTLTHFALAHFVLVRFVLVMGGIIGVAACNPETAKAHPQKTQAAVATDIATTMTGEMADEQSEHIIEIHKMKFQTKLLGVKIGDTVTWINKDIVPHTATAKDKSWDTGQLKKGESFTLTITDQTSLDYFCFYHRQMKAKLVLTTNN